MAIAFIKTVAVAPWRVRFGAFTMAICRQFLLTLLVLGLSEISSRKVVSGDRAPGKSSSLASPDCQNFQDLYYFIVLELCDWKKFMFCLATNFDACITGYLYPSMNLSYKVCGLVPLAEGFRFSQANRDMKSRSKILQRRAIFQCFSYFV